MSLLRCTPALLCLVLACGGGGGGGSSGGTISDAMITVRTTAPSSSLVPAGRTAATWAAYRAPDGSWTKLDATDAMGGIYTFPAVGDRWAVAFACSDGDMALVAIHEDVNTTTDKEIELDRWCAPNPQDGFTLSGTLTHLPGEVGWLDFGYELEARGAVLPNNGTTASYEQVNVAPGTWDLALGVRSDSNAMLSKVALLRRQTVSADARFDVDLSTALIPGSKSVVVHGVGPMNEETLRLPVHYTTNDSDTGLDVGPPTFDQQPNTDVRTTYSTIPPEAQLPGDRYRLELVAEGDVGDSGELTERGATAIFHDATDVEVWLAPPLGAPALMPITQGSFARIEAKTPGRPAAATYSLTARAKITNRQVHEWRITRNVALVNPSEPTVTLTLPDLYVAPGFDANSWGLPADVRREVTVKVIEKPVGLQGNGTIAHHVSHTTIVRPRD